MNILIITMLKCSNDLGNIENAFILILEMFKIFTISSNRFSQIM